MDILFTGSFENALYGTNVKKTKTNSSRTGKVVIAESSRRQATLRHVYGVTNWVMVRIWWIFQAKLGRAFYRVSRYLSPPLPSTTGQCHTLNLYIFIILYQFQISVQIFRTVSLFSYFRLHDLCLPVVRFLMINFYLWFYVCYRKMAITLSIIAVDS